MDIHWRGTYGVGDFMMALNTCHFIAHQNQTRVNLTFYWGHDDTHIHHFEDPETIIERCQFIAKCYEDRERVKIGHVINHRGKFYYTQQQERRGQVINRWAIPEAAKIEDPHLPPNAWALSSALVGRKTTPNKVVIWRPRWNSEPPRLWKRFLTDEDWSDIMSTLEKAGFTITEIDYRTPIREALYHISTCEMTVSYDGMWHYIAKNLFKPMVIITEENISKYHTNRAILTSHRRDSDRENIRVVHLHDEEKLSIWDWLQDPQYLIKCAQTAARWGRRDFERIYNRQSSN